MRTVYCLLRLLQIVPAGTDGRTKIQGFLDIPSSEDNHSWVLL